MKRTLPVVSAAAQYASKVIRPEEMAASVAGSESTESVQSYSDTNFMHYATVETEHPYKQASVSHFRVSRNQGGETPGGYPGVSPFSCTDFDSSLFVTTCRSNSLIVCSG